MNTINVFPQSPGGPETDYWPMYFPRVSTTPYSFDIVSPESMSSGFRVLAPADGSDTGDMVAKIGM